MRFLHPLVRGLLRLFFIHRRWGVERMPRTGAVLVASNHASYLDPLVVGSATGRPLRYLARSTLFRGAFGRLIQALGALPLERGGLGLGGTRSVLDALATGEAVLVFPEGTRSHDGELGKLRTGVVRLARRSGAPIVPVWVEGTYRAWPRGRRLPRPSRIGVRLGEPYRVDPGADPQTATETLRKKLLALAEGPGVVRE